MSRLEQFPRSPGQYFSELLPVGLRLPLGGFMFSGVSDMGTDTGDEVGSLLLAECCPQLVPFSVGVSLEVFQRHRQ